MATNRILTTHAGRLPRPPALTRLYTARSRGETVDETVAGDRRLQGRAVGRRPATCLRHRHRLQRRATARVLRALLAPATGRHRRRRRPAAVRRCRGLPEVQGRPHAHDGQPRGRQQRRQPAALHRRAELSGQGRARRRDRRFQVGDGQGGQRRDGTVFHGRLARHSRHHRQGRPLQGRRRLSRGDRPMPAGRIRGDHRRRLHLADRCARSGHGASQRLWP